MMLVRWPLEVTPLLITNKKGQESQDVQTN